MKHIFLFLLCSFVPLIAMDQEPAGAAGALKRIIEQANTEKKDDTPTDIYKILMRSYNQALEERAEEEAIALIESGLEVYEPQIVWPAIQSGCTRVVSLLLRKNKAKYAKWMNVWDAIDNPAMLALLIEQADKDVNIPHYYVGGHKTTLLMEAVKRKKVQTVHVLLAHGADTDVLLQEDSYEDQETGEHVYHYMTALAYVQRMQNCEEKETIITALQAKNALSMEQTCSAEQHRNNLMANQTNFVPRRQREMLECPF